MLGMVVHTLTSNIWEAGVVGSLWIGEQPTVHNEFQASQGHTVRPFLMKTTQTTLPTAHTQTHREAGDKEGRME